MESIPQAKSSDVSSVITRLEILDRMILSFQSGQLCKNEAGSNTLLKSYIWSELERISGKDRIEIFPIRSMIFQQRFLSASHCDFAEEELSLCDMLMKSVNPSVYKQKAAYYHLKKYKSFLLGFCDDFQEKVSDKHVGYKIPFLMTVTEIAALFTMMKDCGMIAPVSDYRLGEIMEKTCFYEYEKPMKQVRKVISKHRCLEINTEATIKQLKDKLLNSDVLRSKSYDNVSN